MSNSPPLISVVMPVYNCEHFVGEAVESILAQSLGDFELLAYDDGSTDESASRLRRWAERDPRIRLFSMAHAGYVKWLNQGLTDARGRFIARMDADDIAMPRRFAYQARHLEQNPGCVAVGSRVLFMDRDGDPMWSNRVQTGHEAIRDKLLHFRAGTINHPSVMLRADAVRGVGGYRAEYEYIEDRDLFLRLMEVGTLANLDEVLLKYRLHPASVCHTRQTEQVERRLRLYREMSARWGLPADPPASVATLQRLSSPTTPAQMRYVCDRALRNGFRKTARKYALASLRLEPGATANWWLTADAVLGRKSTTRLKRAYQRLKSIVTGGIFRHSL